jgi:hypothetical protein
MSFADQFEAVVARLIKAAENRERLDIPEQEVIGYIEELTGDHDKAVEAWESVAAGLRNWIVRGGYALQWNFIGNVVRVRALPTAEELESAAELYELATPLDLEERIKKLSGVEFERFLGEVLGTLPQLRHVSVTQPSRDGGIDFKGTYVAEHASPHFTLVGQATVIGQAKQISAPLAVDKARDFIGALDTAGERRVLGILVSTGGFTEPALDALRRSRFFIITWGLKDLLDISQAATTRRIQVSFSMPDETFWDELLGRTKTS